MMPHEVDETTIINYPIRSGGCIILSHDHKIILQKRDSTTFKYPDYICTFGGKIDDHELPIEGMIRELQEELGAYLIPSELIYLTRYTDPMSNYNELIYGYFWYDKYHKITGCYEGQLKRFDNLDHILQEKKVMYDVPFLIKECQHKQLL